MRGQESIKWANIAATAAPSSPSNNGNASAPITFQVEGGQYQLDIVGTTIGSAQINGVGPDGSTLIPHGTQSTTGAPVPTQTLLLAPGTYELVVSGATALYASLTRIPTD